MKNVPHKAPHAVEIAPQGAKPPAPMPTMPNVPRALRGVFQRAESGGSRKAGMHAYCWQCVGFEQEEVRRCSAPECPLWEWRPIKPKHQHTEEKQSKTQERREAEQKRIARLNRRYVPVFGRAYEGKSRVDAVKAFAFNCLNGNEGPCGTKICPLAPYCPGAKREGSEYTR